MVTPIQLLARYAPRILPDYYKPDCCIAGTAITIDVLAHFRIKARPFPVKTMVFNPVFTDMILKRGSFIPFTEAMKENPMAYSVGIGYGEKREGGYLGHLVALADDILIDLTLPQASRPQYNMVCTAVTTKVPQNFIAGTNYHVLENSSGVMVVYQKNDNDGYLVSPDWTDKERRHEVVTRLIRRIRNH